MTKGGKRAGAGRKSTRIGPPYITVPPLVLVQLQEIAAAEHATVVDVVREAILSYIADWQDRHDNAPTP